MKYDMFSMIPSTGVWVIWNIASPLRASSSETVCGVVTITHPVTCTSWTIDS